MGQRLKGAAQMNAQVYLHSGFHNHFKSISDNNNNNNCNNYSNYSNYSNFNNYSNFSIFSNYGNSFGFRIPSLPSSNLGSIPAATTSFW